MARNKNQVKPRVFRPRRNILLESSVIPSRGDVNKGLLLVAAIAVGLLPIIIIEPLRWQLAFPQPILVN